MSQKIGRWQSREMVQAPSCCAELKTAGKEWLEAVGTEEQGEKAVALLAEAKADILYD